MLGRRQAYVLPCILLLAYPATASAPERFEGDLKLVEPVTTVANLSTEGVGFVSLFSYALGKPASAGQETVEAASALVRLREQRSTELNIPPRSPFPVAPPSRVVEEFNSTGLVGRLLETHEQHGWLTLGKNTNASLYFSGNCNVSASAPNTTFFVGDQQSGRKLETAVPANEVYVDCEPATLGLTAFTRLWIHGSTVRLVDAEGRNMTVWTGTRTEVQMIGSKPVAERVTRILELTPYDDRSAMTMSDPGRLQLSTPALVAAGELVIPNSARGIIKWGILRHEGGDLPEKPNGVFAITTSDASALQIRGATTNFPTGYPVPAAPIPISSGAALTGALVAAAATWLLFKNRFWIFAAFTRILGSKTLDHPLRRSIVDFVRENPGSQIQEVARALGVSFGTAKHHVRILANQKQISLRQFGRTTAIFEHGRLSPQQQVEAAYLRTPQFRKLRELLQLKPSLTQRQLALRLEVSQPRVWKMVRRLERAGLIAGSGEGLKRPRALEAGLSEAAASDA